MTFETELPKNPNIFFSLSVSLYIYMNLFFFFSVNNNTYLKKTIENNLKHSLLINRNKFSDD